MEVLVFDIETNGITDFVSLDELAVIHCLCIRDIRHDNVMVFNSDKGNIEEGLSRLTNADVIVGHNVLGFDIPAIRKLYPDWETDDLKDLIAYGLGVYEWGNLSLSLE